MTKKHPHFETDGELEEWFESADLRVDDLEPALEVEMGDSVEIFLDEPWTTTAHSAASAPSGVIESRVPA